MMHSCLDRALTWVAPCLAASLAVSASAQTTVWIPCAKDNTLFQSPSGLSSSGAGAGLFVGLTGQSSNNIRRALLQFDVASMIPAGAHIVSAALTVNVERSNDVNQLPVTGHRVLKAWGEGTSVAVGGGGGAGGAAATGDATWLHTFFATSFWTNIGGDFQAAPSLTMSLPILGLATSPASATTNADVQFWLDNPAQNFGWLLKSAETPPNGNARRIDSRESAGVRPFLAVTYVAPGQAGTFGVGCPSGSGNFQFVFVGSSIGGNTMNLVHLNGPPGSVAVNFFSLGFDPAGVSLLPGCTIHLPLAQPLIPGFTVFLDGQGNGSSSWTLPTIYPGLYVASQSAAIDSNPLGFITSNAGVLVIQ
jgi:hypothetical protein